MPQTKRELVLAAVKRRYVDVPMDDLIPGVPFIRLQSLSAGELNKVRDKRVNAQSVTDLKIAIENEPRRLIVASAIEDDNSPMFTIEDLIAMEETDAGVVERLHDFARAHVAPLRTVEDIAKNSEATGEPSLQVK